MRETIVGTLHVIRTRKRYRGLLDDYIARVLEEDRPELTRWWPEIYYVTTDREAPWGDRKYQYRFRGEGRRAAKPLSPDLEGATVEVVATMEEFSNGFGAYLNRPIVKVLEEADAET